MFEGVLEQGLIGGISALLLMVIFASLMRSRKENANLLQPGGITPLMNAVIQTEPQKMVKLIEDGADINAQNEEGMSALMFSVTSEFYDAAEILLKSGASPDLLNSSGQSARDLATRKGLNDFVTLLDTYAQQGN